MIVALLSYGRSFVYTNILKNAESIANKLELTKSLPTDEQLSNLNKLLSRMNADDILLWAHKHFQKSLVDVTSFGPSGLVILHKLQQLGLLENTPVVTIDTLHLFPDTYKFVEELNHTDMLKGVAVQVYRPKGYSTRKDFDEAFGADLWKTDPDKYAYLSKVEPTLRALDETHAIAWLTGRRRSQGGERTQLQVLEVDTSNTDTLLPRYKVNPLAYWPYDEVWKYIRKNHIPYNKLHDEGYKSIGDYMSTAPVDPKSAERSGRFVGLGTSECGIHATRAKIQRMKE